MKLPTSGGPHTSTYGTVAAEDDVKPTADPKPSEPESTSTVVGGTPVVEEPVETPVAPEPPLIGTPVAVETPVVVEKPLVLETPLVETGSDHETPLVDPGSDHETEPIHTLGLAARTANANGSSRTDPDLGVQALSLGNNEDQALAVNSLAVPPAPEPVVELVAPPLQIGFFGQIVRTLLSPFFGVNPLAPAPMPFLWTIFAWIRREITHTFFNASPVAYPVQVSQSLTGVVTGNLNAGDPNGDPLYATVTQQGAYGNVVIAPDGTYTYTPTGVVPITGMTDTFQVGLSDSRVHVGGVLGLVQGVFENIARFLGIAQPDITVKTVQVTVAAGVLPSLPGAVVVVPPALVYTGVGAQVTLASSVTIVDVDSTQATKATVSFDPVTYQSGKDVLTYTGTVAGISQSWNATTGVLTLSSTNPQSLADYQTALQSVKFSSTSTDLVGARTVSLVVTSNGVASLPGAVAVVIAAIPTNLPGVVVVVPPALIYTGAGSQVTLARSVTIVDADSTQATKATVSFDPVTYQSGKDVLGYTGSVVGITSSFNPGTGVLTLSSVNPLSLADYQTALQSVKFSSTSTDLVGARTVSLVVTSNGVASLPGAVAVLLTRVNAPGVVLVSPVLLYGAGNPAVTLAPTVSISDLDSPQASSATVQITVGYEQNKDKLTYTGPLAQSWDANSGTLTLTGNATLADYQTALQSVKFSSTATALVAAKTVSVGVTADGVAAVPGLVLVTVVALPVPASAPGVVLVSPVLLYGAGNPAVTLAPTVSISDLDSPQASSATVQITVGYEQNKDKLTYTGPLAQSWDANSGTLTLTGNATLADYQTALQSVKFSSTATALVAAKTVSVGVTADGVAAVPGLVLVTVVALPVPASAPGVVLVSPVLLYGAGNPAVTLAPTVSISDLDSPQASSATVQITVGYEQNKDKLTYTGPLAQSWDANSGTLTLTGNATLADYQTALQSVKFSSTATALVAAKTVSVGVTADGVAAVPGLVLVTVVALPVPASAPGVVLVSPVLLYGAGNPAVTLAPTVSISDLDSPQASSATVQITVGYEQNKDKLTYTGPLAQSWDANSGTLTLTGNATLADYQTALQSVKFSSTATALVAAKTVSVGVTADGVAAVPGLVLVTVVALPVPASAPGVVLVSPVLLYGAGNPAVTLAPTVSISDLDSPQASSATVQITVGYEQNKDKLTYTGPLAQSWDANSGTLTLTGNATLADYQTALQSVKFSSTATALVAAKTVSVGVTADGVAAVPGLVLVTVVALPVPASAPGVVLVSPVLLYGAGNPAVTLAPTVSISDLDSPQASSATVQITVGYEQNKDKLTYTGPLAQSWDANSGTLTLTGNATLADYQTALQSVKFSSTATALVAAKTVSVGVTADGVAAVPGLVLVTVVALPVQINIAPFVTASLLPRTYTAGGTAIVLAPSVVVTEVNPQLLSGATITIGTGKDANDVLSFADIGSIKFGSYNGGVLTLTGLASAADYQAALRTVTFSASSAAAQGTRLVSIVVTDGLDPSLPANVSVNVLANQAPLVIGSLVNLTPYTVGNLPTVLDPAVTLADDSALIQSAKVTIAPGTLKAGDMLDFTQPQGVSLTPSFAGGVLTLSGNATAQQYQEALRSVTFATDASGLIGTRSFTFEVKDFEGLTGTSLPLTALVKANTAPVVVSSLGLNLSVLNNTVSAVGSGIAIADDSSRLVEAKVTVTGLLLSISSDTLSANVPAGISKSWDPANKILTLSGAASVTDYQTALQSLSFTTNGGILSVHTVTIVVKDQQGLSSAPVALTVAVVNIL